MPDITRRQFIQLTVIAGAAAATGLGCSRGKEEQTGRYGGTNSIGQPYVDQPVGLTDGVPQYFATTCRMCSAACGIIVRTMGGRAITIAGNPAHPVNTGGACARGQAALQQVYNPARLRFPSVRKAPAKTTSQVSWDAVLAGASSALVGSRNQVAIVVDSDTVARSPSCMVAVHALAKSVGAKVVNYSLVDDGPWRAASVAVWGRDAVPAYKLGNADVIISFGGNFLESWPTPVYAAAEFGEFRQGSRRKPGERGYFAFVGPRMSMTAAKADNWIPCAPGAEGVIAEAIRHCLVGRTDHVSGAALAAGISEQKLVDLANRFRMAGPRAVAVAGDGLNGYSDATGQFAAVENLNKAVDSQCVGFGDSPFAPTKSGGSSKSGYRQIETLVADLVAGTVTAVLVVGSPNPTFALPSASKFKEALNRASFVGAIASFDDETTASAHVLMPSRTFLEEWSDAVGIAVPAGLNVANITQPIIDPQYIQDAAGKPWMDTRPTIDILNELNSRIKGGRSFASAEDTVKATWAAAGIPDVTKTAATGFVGRPATSSSATVTAKPAVGEIALGAVVEPPHGSYRLIPYPHIYWYDGRHAHLPWLQELPDPMTAAVWNSWVEINMETAHRLGIRTGDIVRLSTAHGSIDVPAIPYPGIHPGCIAMPIGQGHTEYGDTANRGINPMAIFEPITDHATGALAYGASTVKLEKIRSADDGYHPELQTLVLLQDRPNGQEPEAVQGLIHETAKEWKTHKNAT